MILKRKLEKQEINALPLKAYDGEIFIINTLQGVKNSCSILQKENILGFDTETRPSFQKGEYYSPSIIQLAAEKSVYIFQLHQVGFCNPLKQLLSNSSVLKCGVAINHDLSELNLLSEFIPRGFVDLGELARKALVPHHGLRGLAAYFLRFRISKQAQISKWNAKTLKKKQIIYAATDAWIGRELYLKFKKEKIL